MEESEFTEKEKLVFKKIKRAFKTMRWVKMDPI